jgi:hypothetical protein
MVHIDMPHVHGALVVTRSMISLGLHALRHLQTSARNITIDIEGLGDVRLS